MLQLSDASRFLDMVWNQAAFSENFINLIINC